MSVLGSWKQGQYAFIGELTGVWEVQPFYFPDTIHNTANMNFGELRAGLTFYTREEMLEM